MNDKALDTIQAFLIALKQQEQPLPDEVWLELEAIAPNLPESVHKLHELAERHETLHQQYCLALHNLPEERERLNGIPSQSRPTNSAQSMTFYDGETQLATIDIEKLIQQLHHQMSHLSDNSKSYLIKELGWTQEKALATRYAFQAFQEDWEDPSMEIYDDL